GWATQRNRISPWVAVGKTTSWDWMRASSSRMVRGELPRPALLPHFEALPEHEGEEANEDVGLDPVLPLMPDRTQVQLILVNAKSCVGLSELDVGLPKLSVAPIADVRAQERDALREGGPIVERGVVIDAEAKGRRAGVGHEGDGEAGCGALVLLE